MSRALERSRATGSIRFGGHGARTERGTEGEISKYRSIQAQLRERAASLPVGTRLPAERQLAREFGVSLMTMRRALGELADEGRVTRQPGHGTFVRRPVVTMGPELTSFTEDMRRRGLEPSALLLGLHRVAAEPDVARNLGVDVGDDVAELRRLRLADGEPMCVEVGHLPVHLMPLLERSDLTGSLHEILAGEGIVLAVALRCVKIAVAAAEENAMLDLPEGAPTLQIVDTFLDSAERPVQTARSRYRPDRYEVHSRLVRSEAPPPPASSPLPRSPTMSEPSEAE
jgi:GntR family transcriptional regulator